MLECVYQSPRGAVHYWKSESPAAKGKTLVMLHGLTADHRLFDKQVPYFEQKYSLILWDAPAHGKSRPYADFTFPRIAEDLKGILDENGIDTAIMIGQSMGGLIMQAFLLRYPERVSAAVFIDSCPLGDYYSKSDLWWLRQIEWMAKLFPFGTLKTSIAKASTQTESAYNNLYAMLEPYDKNELCHLMGIAYGALLEDNRPLEIQCPTLLLVGEHDTTGKVRQYNRAWTKKTGFPLRVIPNAAHDSNDDNPEVVNREIESFLNGIG